MNPQWFAPATLLFIAACSSSNDSNGAAGVTAAASAGAGGNAAASSSGVGGSAVASGSTAQSTGAGGAGGAKEGGGACSAGLKVPAVCLTCIDAHCCAETATCATTDQCQDAFNCIHACANNDAACWQVCFGKYPKGLGASSQIDGCLMKNCAQCSP